MRRESRALARCLVEAPASPTALRELQPLREELLEIAARQRTEMDAQKRLLADASHQLRTPLAVLRSQLQSALDADSPASSHVPDALRTLDRATAVALEVLSRMKIEQRERQPVPWTTVVLEDVAKEAAIEFAPLIAARHLEFALEATPIAVAADAWMLGELVRNLLANAIRHCAEGGPLGIVVRSVAGRPELIVWDSGSGLPSAQRDRLFEPFAASEGGSGVGLGLSICRQFAHALGAEVELFDRIEGGRRVGVDACVRWSEPTRAKGAGPPAAPGRP